jgi:hypothetical protein
VEANDLARPRVTSGCGQEAGRIRLEHQHVAANNSVEWFVKYMKRRLTLDVAHVAVAPAASPRRVDGFRGIVDTNDVPPFTHHLRQQQRGVAGSTADVENAHA